MDETPASLLDQLQQGPDDAAWERLAALYTPFLKGWLRSFGVREPDADDILQETLLGLFKGLPGFVHNRRPGAFRSYVRSVLVNRLLPFFRERKRTLERPLSQEAMRRLEELQDSSSAQSDQWDLDHDRHVVTKLLEMIEPEFEPNTWKAFVRVGLEDASHADTARELGLTVNAITIAKCRVLARLKQLAKGLTG